MHLGEQANVYYRPSCVKVHSTCVVCIEKLAIENGLGIQQAYYSL